MKERRRRMRKVGITVQKKSDLVLVGGSSAREITLVERREQDGQTGAVKLE